MQATKVPVCTIGVFNTTHDLWMDNLEGLLQKYPVLSTPHTNAFYLLLCIEQGEGNSLLTKIRSVWEQLKY
ncbi:hypothetical protein QNH98_19605 [Myroides sp. mNGS23_01]|nr:hypothetical protein [Myroides sp. mNGS23_01]WHT39116.1 hypothetical protein QNH98_19605 [Myroides sp. mNGS23_01]